ncbi:MAG: hypothetical protein OXB88_08760 [Bacteriovoracales bacterium]|nr:hypothetical protein [Bacteriovoracales bacterium]
MKTNRFNENFVEEIGSRLWKLEYSLKGLAALFERSSGDPPLEKDEFFGIGQILENFAREISDLEDLINSRYDSDDES